MAQPNIVPRVTEAETLGTTLKRWLTLFVKNIVMSPSGTISNGTSSFTVAQIAGSPAATWGIVSSGSAVCSDNTITYLATITGVLQGEFLLPFVGPSGQGTTLYEIWQAISTLGISSGSMIYGLEKTTTPGEYRLYVKQRSGAVATIYWKVYKAAA